MWGSFVSRFLVPWILIAQGPSMMDYVPVISGPPPPAEARAEVRDAAEVFGSHASRQAQEDLSRIHREYHVPVRIETVKTLDGARVADVARRRARSVETRQLYILVARDERDVGVVAAREGPASRLSDQQQEQIGQAFLGPLQAGHADAALYRGLEAIGEVIESSAAARRAGLDWAGLLMTTIVFVALAALGAFRVWAENDDSGRRRRRLATALSPPWSRNEPRSERLWGRNHCDSSPAPRSRRRALRPRTFTIGVTLLVGPLVLVWASGLGRSTLHEIGATTTPGATDEDQVTSTRSWAADSGQPWDGLLRVNEQSQKALGLSLTVVVPQTEPIRLEVLGTTGYMTDFQTIIRPMFKGRADKVHVSIGQNVEKDDPLVDLYSAELAEAKSNFEIKRAHWTYDESLLKQRHELLHRSQAIAAHVYEETRRDEMKSRVEAKVAFDKLRLYGLTDSEIARVTDEDGERKARLSLRSPASGVAISRAVVPENLYDENDTLLIIAPLDRLWVWGHVFERDLDKLRLGQPWEIRFPYLGLDVRGKIEHISSRIDPGTRAVKIRTSIPNVAGRLKSDMLVWGTLESTPLPECVVIPRSALTVADGPDYVFVKVPGTSDAFERRTVRVIHERRDDVVIDEGLRAGEEVVGVGSLILAQAHEDLRMVHADSASDNKK